MDHQRRIRTTGRASVGVRIFSVFNYIFVTLIALTCLLPMVNLLAISFSSSSAVSTGQVSFWPVDFTLESYSFMAGKPEFFASMKISVLRILLAVPLSMIVSVLAAYPLSRQNHEFGARKYYVWIFIVPMMFYGGLIPSYMVVRNTGLIDSIWALVLPCSINVFNIILLMNFFRSIPKELEEAAAVDGAGHFRILLQVVLPVSTPVLATVLLFFIVNHWNSWFDGLIYMNSPSKYPLQTYLQTQVVNRALMALEAMRDIRRMGNISDRTGKAAQIFLAAVPVLAVYPFLQKYFTTGIVMGSVKG
ncbi:MAG TPA: carbohydrate ABC transporter permease [Clostridiales bacterium]|nr:carbohydrate ABC transporter permease [Clostridiales bacterium]